MVKHQPVLGLTSGAEVTQLKTSLYTLTNLWTPAGMPQKQLVQFLPASHSGTRSASERRPSVARRHQHRHGKGLAPGGVDSRQRSGGSGGLAGR